MPCGVFYVFGVYGTVEFELFCAVFVSACVVEGDAALPVVGFFIGVGFEIFVEIGDGFFDLGGHEMVYASALIGGVALGIEFQRFAIIEDRFFGLFHGVVDDCAEVIAFGVGGDLFDVAG